MIEDKLVICISTKGGSNADEFCDKLRANIESNCGVDTVFEFVVNPGTLPLTRVYNCALDKYKDYRYIVFMHDDVECVTHLWGRKLIDLFNRYPEYGVIGAAGSKTLPNDGVWWNGGADCLGEVVHFVKNKTNDGMVKFLSVFSQCDDELAEACCMDGLFLAVDRSRCKTRFDEKTFDGFHFYDVSFTFDNFLSGESKNGVTKSFRLVHRSVGNSSSPEYNKYRLLFISKNRGNLPVVNLKKRENVKEEK